MPRNQADTILNVLGANIGTAAAEDPPARRFGCDPADRIIAQSATQQTIPADIAVQWDETYLSFIITILRPLETDEEHYKINIGVLDIGFVRYWVTIGRRGAEFIENYANRASLEVLESGFRVRIVFPWWHLRCEVHRKNALAATVAISRWSGVSAAARNPLMVVPLRISR